MSKVNRKVEGEMHPYSKVNRKERRDASMSKVNRKEGGMHPCQW